MGGSKRVGNARAVRRSLLYGPPTVLPFSVFVLLCAARSPRFLFFPLPPLSLMYTPPCPLVHARLAAGSACLLPCFGEKLAWCCFAVGGVRSFPRFWATRPRSWNPGRIRALFFFLQPPLCFNLFVLGVQISGRERKKIAGPGVRTQKTSGPEFGE